MARNKPEIDPNALKKNFNLVSTSIDNDVEFGERFLHSKHWTEKILKISLGLIIASIILFCIGVLGFVTKPVPAVYATSEYGTLYELDRFSREEALRAIEQYSNPNNVESNAANNNNANTTANPNQNPNGGAVNPNTVSPNVQGEVSSALKQ